MLPLGIPLYTLLFCSLYMIVYPASAHGRAFWTENLIENALHVALLVSFLCLPLMWFTLGGPRSGRKVRYMRGPR
jgi:hypothetical protein